MHNAKVAMRARTLQKFASGLYNTYILFHHEGNEVLADKVYKLQQDCIFDNYMDLQTAKNRLKRILA